MRNQHRKGWTINQFITDLDFTQILYQKFMRVIRSLEFTLNKLNNQQFEICTFNICGSKTGNDFLANSFEFLLFTLIESNLALVLFQKVVLCFVLFESFVLLDEIKQKRVVLILVVQNVIKQNFVEIPWVYFWDDSILLFWE